MKSITEPKDFEDLADAIEAFTVEAEEDQWVRARLLFSLIQEKSNGRIRQRCVKGNVVLLIVLSAMADDRWKLHYKNSLTYTPGILYLKDLEINGYVQTDKHGYVRPTRKFTGINLQMEMFVHEETAIKAGNEQ